MFVRELPSKMVINRIRNGNYGMIEMGEIRLSIPINNEDINNEKIKRSFLVNIEIRELEGEERDNKRGNNTRNIRGGGNIRGRGRGGSRGSGNSNRGSNNRR